ncbi:hypothetical protein PInf_023454 [Phytophthora infestans]|nr:hypothetical protein PInf_023454 [Phytophthora infestans]
MCHAGGHARMSARSETPFGLDIHKEQQFDRSSNSIMSTANVTGKWRLSDPHAELPIKNHKYVKNCTEMYMANKRIDKIANFDAFVSLEVLWINDNQELDGQDGCFRLKQIYAHNNCIRYAHRNYYDRKACAEFEVRGVFDWLKVVIERDITRMEKWLDLSRKERKEIANLKRIPALKEIQKKIDRQNDPSSNHKGGNNEAKLLKDTSGTVHWAVSEEDMVNVTPAEEVKAEKEEGSAASTEGVL